MNKINAYISIAQVAVSVGLDIAGKLKGIIETFDANHGLTDAEINAMEVVAMIDTDKRIAERKEMAKPTVVPA